MRRISQAILVMFLVWSGALLVPAQTRLAAKPLKQINSNSRPAARPEAARADQFDSVRMLIRQQLVEQQIPSMAVAVARDGEILWEEGFGWADRENLIPATEHTMYSLASITKPFTATGLMILQQQGKLDLDRPLNDYLGAAKIKAWAGNAAELTVRRVANHSAGLPIHYQFFYEDEPYRVPAMDETIRRYGHSVAPPGEAYEYSNFGYGVLGYLIARLSGQSYADFMRTEVFLPLGMTRTSVDIGPGLAQHAAKRYGTDGLPIPFYDFDHPAASAIYSSAHDLIRFGMFHLKAQRSDQKAILTDQAIDAMQQPTIKSSLTSGYGIGWATGQKASGHQTVAHTGGMGGVSTILQLIPAARIAIVVLTNSRSGLMSQVVQAVSSILLKDSASPPPSNQPPSESAPPFKPGSELVGTWQGTVHTYQAELPLKLVIHESGDVHVRLGNQLETLLNDATFRDGKLSGRLMGDIGTEDANRRPYVLRLLVKLRGNVLNGALTAFSTPGKRVGNALSHWVELKKQ